MTDTVRMLLLGDMAVGKSHLLERFVDGGWTEQITPGLTIVRRPLQVGDVTYTLQIFDAPGAPRMWVGHRDSPYLRSITCVMVVYDVTNRESFEHIGMWLDEADSLCAEGGCRLIVGTKADVDQKREVSWEHAQRVADQLSVPIIETSAWTVHNVTAAFTLALTAEIQRRAQLPSAVDEGGVGGGGGGGGAPAQAAVTTNTTTTSTTSTTRPPRRGNVISNNNNEDDDTDGDEVNKTRQEESTEEDSGEDQQQ